MAPGFLGFLIVGTGVVWEGGRWVTSRTGVDVLNGNLEAVERTGLCGWDRNEGQRVFVRTSRARTPGRGTRRRFENTRGKVADIQSVPRGTAPRP